MNHYYYRYCSVLFTRVLSAAIEEDTHGDVYKQIVVNSIAEKTLAMYDDWNSLHMANIHIERKEEVIGAAMGMIKWIMQKCAKIHVDSSTNDYSFQYLSDDECALNAFIDKALDSRDLYSTLLRHLRSIVAATTVRTSVALSENLLESANSTCSFIRMLLEVDRVIPDIGRHISDRISVDFESVFMELVERNISLLARAHTSTRAAASSRKRSVLRLRCLLRVLSLLTVDNTRMPTVDARLLALLQTPSTLTTGSQLMIEDFSGLRLELTNIVSLPDTKIFVALNAVDQSQRALLERDQLKVLTCIQDSHSVPIIMHG